MQESAIITNVNRVTKCCVIILPANKRDTQRKKKKWQVLRYLISLYQSDIIFKNATIKQFDIFQEIREIHSAMNEAKKYNQL
jgi:hypothetical protein